MREDKLLGNYEISDFSRVSAMPSCRVSEEMRAIRYAKIYIRQDSECSALPLRWTVQTSHRAGKSPLNCAMWTIVHSSSAWRVKLWNRSVSMKSAMPAGRRFVQRVSYATTEFRAWCLPDAKSCSCPWLNHSCLHTALKALHRLCMRLMAWHGWKPISIEFHNQIIPMKTEWFHFRDELIFTGYWKMISVVESLAIIIVRGLICSETD